MGASIARKRTRLGRRVLRHKLAQGCAFSCIMTCFSCTGWSFDTQSVLVRIFTKYVPSRSFGSHVTWNSAVPDPNVWCCILLFLCTLDAVGRNGNDRCARENRTAPDADLFLRNLQKKLARAWRCPAFYRGERFRSRSWTTNTIEKNVY